MLEDKAWKYVGQHGIHGISSNSSAHGRRHIVSHDRPLPDSIKEQIVADLSDGEVVFNECAQEPEDHTYRVGE